MWVALDDADEENGCLVYVKGSGVGPLRPHQPSGILGFSQKCTDYGSPEDLKKEMVMAAKAGDVIAHNSAMMHRTGANTSTRHRRAIGLVYFGVSAKTDDVRRAAYQKSLRDTLAAAKRI
jgi:ectoine hydroxylase-related dioxygenase (phytanoyl-CoA dioxygenase family)